MIASEERADQPEAFELYNLEKDPGETQNLYGRAEHAGVQEELINRLSALQNKTPLREGVLQG